MQSFTRVIGIGILAVAGGLLTGCTRHSKSEHYYLIATNTKLPYWQTANAGFLKAAQEYGVTAEMRGPDTFDPDAEVQEFHNMVARKPAGILVSVGNAEKLGPEIDAAVAAGIPVITIDSDAPESKRLYFIGTNNLEAGRLGGRRVAAVLNGKGNVVFFTNPGQPNLDERMKGYKDAFSAFPGIKVADVYDIKGDPANAMDKAREYLARNGADKIDAFISLESASGKEVAEAIKRTPCGGCLVVAMDTDEATLQLIKSGRVDSTISQKPYTMALLGLKGLDEIHHNPIHPLAQEYGLDPFSPFPAFVDTGVALVDKTNVDGILTRREAEDK
ncbi:MAG: substrate-binding domain-containing protein [Acidobacteriota bacterium]|nr:substrate-binding domain-containing protein [Acidobacteriota bacterium]